MKTKTKILGISAILLVLAISGASSSLARNDFALYQGIDVRNGINYHHVDITTTCSKVTVITEGKTVNNFSMPHTSDTIHLRIFDVPHVHRPILIMDNCGDRAIIRT